MSKILQKPQAFYENFERKPSQQHTTHYCPGCGHGVLNKLMAESIDELGIKDRIIFVGPVGCGVFFYYYFHCAGISSPHGRASAVAAGVNRSDPNAVTISYQGDGDLAALGTNNAIHAANRGERMIVFFVNNNLYGMTGGQMAPTTLIDQKTTTTPYGRSMDNDGAPLKMAEIMALLDSPVLVARVAVNKPKNIRLARKVIQKGFQAQKDKKGYVFIEVLSQCPTNWKKDPLQACRWIDDTVSQYYPLGILKDTVDKTPSRPRRVDKASFEQIAELLHLHQDVKSLEQEATLPFETVHFKSAGFGGQGVLSLGIVLADAAMKKGFHVTWLPSYGPEMRGGTANSGVVIKKTQVGSPMVDNPNILVAMNKPSLFKFGPLVPENGWIFYNSSLIDEIPQLKASTFPVPATDLAKDVGTIKVANTIFLAVIAARSGLFTLEELSSLLREYFPDDKLHQVNVRALEAGFKIADGLKS